MLLMFSVLLFVVAFLACRLRLARSPKDAQAAWSIRASQEQHASV